MIFHETFCDFSRDLLWLFWGLLRYWGGEAEATRLNTVKALVLYKFKNAIIEFGKPEHFKAEVAKAVKAKQAVELEQAVANAKAKAMPRAGLMGFFV